MTTGCRDMRGAGVVPNGENGRVGKIDQSGNPGAADEIDRNGASCTDFGRDWLLAPRADDNWRSTGCLEQALGQLGIAPRGPTLGRVAWR